MDPTLYRAAMEGNVHVLLENLDQLGVQVTPNGNTVLHIAALYGKKECVEVILKEVPSLLSRANNKGNRVLHIAAREGHFTIVQVLVECAKSFARVDHDGAFTDAREILRLTSNDGGTALHEAIRYHHLDIAKLLVEQDPDLSHLLNKANETPLYLAASNGHDDCVSDILRTCSSPSYSGPGGRTALHAAVISDSNVSMANLLQWKPKLSEEADGRGWTPLHYAAHLGHLERVSQLLHINNQLAYATTDDEEMNTALHLATSGGHVNVMKDLLLHSPDCSEMVNRRGCNILHTALENKENEVVKFVLETPSLSYLVNQEDNDGNTPLHLLGTSGYSLPNLVQAKTGNCENDSIDTLEETGRGRGRMWSCTEVGKAGGEISINLTDTAAVESQNSILENVSQMNTVNKEVKFLDGMVTKMMDPVDKAKRAYTKEYIDGARKMADTHLIVAALVATVAFTAGFTMPGGYIQDDRSPNQGMAVLTRLAAFKAFIITDAIALVLSTSAIFIYIGLDIEEETHVLLRFIEGARRIVLLSIEAMMVAFVTGTFAVLERSSGLAIATCTIGCSSFLIHCIIVVHAAILAQNKEHYN